MFGSWTTPKSRATRCCNEGCGHTIQPGEIYSRWDGHTGEDWHSFIRCASCEAWFNAFDALGADVEFDFRREQRPLFEIASEDTGDGWTVIAMQRFKRVTRVRYTRTIHPYTFDFSGTTGL